MESRAIRAISRLPVDRPIVYDQLDGPGSPGLQRGRNIVKKGPRRRRRAGPAAARATPPSRPGPAAKSSQPIVAETSPPGDRHAAVAVKSAASQSARPPAPEVERLAALDLGTNNCRLLIASPRGRKLRIVDAFSRIVRLGEGLSQTGRLSEAAMERTIDALKVCADKIARRGVTRSRCIATQACRAAANGPEFLHRIKVETGLEFEIISTAEEARLAVAGCADLIDHTASAGLIFDIGGGSTEVSFVRPGSSGANARAPEIAGWFSMPYGVVNICEAWGGRDVSRATYDAIVSAMRAEIAAFGDPAGLRPAFEAGEGHLLGTSGTVTSIAGVHLSLPRYRREAVDGVWLTIDEARSVPERLRSMPFDERAREPCIGPDRADLVIGGCAILEALVCEWPAARVRVADRGLREGILHGLAAKRAPRRRWPASQSAPAATAGDPA